MCIPGPLFSFGRVGRQRLCFHGIYILQEGLDNQPISHCICEGDTFIYRNPKESLELKVDKHRIRERRQENLAGSPPPETRAMMKVKCLAPPTFPSFLFLKNYLKIFNNLFYFSYYWGIIGKSNCKIFKAHVRVTDAHCERMPSI